MSSGSLYIQIHNTLFMTFALNFPLATNLKDPKEGDYKITIWVLGLVVHYTSDDQLFLFYFLMF